MRIQLVLLLYAHTQGSNLTVARSPLATKHDDGRLKILSKVARLATDFFIIFIIGVFLENIIRASEIYGQVMTALSLARMATQKKKKLSTDTAHVCVYTYIFSNLIY